MYCVKCGVKLADSERKCALCGTVVSHPDFNPDSANALYPTNKMPKTNSGSKALCGAIVILFLIPLFVSYLADSQTNGRLDWFGFVAGALGVAYVTVALPAWFKKPNPVIFVPCSFAAATLYLCYINLETKGDWFLNFAFPVMLGVCLLTCAVVTLVYYLKRGRLYIFGGAFIALGLFMLLVEYLMILTFKLRFIGWSTYPLVVLVLFGGLLIYFAINSSAREAIKRKLFF